MTIIEELARKQYGSLRKMILKFNLKPGTVYPVVGKYRRSWPKLREQLAAALGMHEDALFDEIGWPREVDGNA